MGVCISLVVAAATNNAIGKDGKMPWHLPNDLKHFKNITWGMPIIMGRKTFESIGKALPGRKNIVVTHNPDWKAEGAIAVQKIDDALFVAAATDAKEIMVIGGGEIYKLLFPKATRIYMTRVATEPYADTYFPAIDSKYWKLVSQENHTANEKNAFHYSFQLWERI